MSIKCLTPTVGTLDLRIAAPSPPYAPTEAFYHSPEYRAWRDLVLKRANYACEAAGCTPPRRGRGRRLFADHRVELRDGDAPLDLDNGQCLCPQKHQSHGHLDTV